MQRENQQQKGELKENDLFNCIVNYFALLEQQENTLQAFREALTTRTDFHPLTLFNYLSRAEGIVSRKHILMLLQENSFIHTD